MNRLTKQMLGLAATALLLAGCQAGAQSDSNDVSVMGTSQERSTIQVANKQKISLDEAKQIAFDHAGVDGEKAIFDDKEYESEDNKYELEFKVDQVEYEYDIDAVTGEILEVEKDVNHSKEKQTKQVIQSKSEFIGMDKAVEIALNDAGVKLDQVKWDDKEFDKSDRLYELEFDAVGFEFEYDINALTGDIVKREKDQDDDHNKQKQLEVKKGTKKEVKKPVVAKEITKEEAIAIALKHAGVSRSDARFDDVELDSDDSVRYWEIEFKAGNYEYEYDILASNGKITDVEREKSDEDKVQEKKLEVKKEPVKISSQLTKEEAIAIALKHAGVSRDSVEFDDVELDTDDGVKYWEVEFESGNYEYEYDIHATSGKVLDYEVEYDD